MPENEQQRRLLSAAELAEMKFPIPKKLGPWSFDTEHIVISHKTTYEVDVMQCTTSASTLDWIAQVAAKPWCTYETLGQLVRFLDDLLGFQINLCPDGNEKMINDVRFLIVSRIARDGLKD